VGHCIRSGRRDVSPEEEGMLGGMLPSRVLSFCMIWIFCMNLYVFGMYDFV